MGTVGAWFVLIAILGRGPGAIAGLSRGRSAAAEAILGNAPAVVFCIPVAGAAVLATARIATERLQQPG